MLNLIIHLDDEAERLDKEVWDALEDVVYNVALSYHQEARSTEGCYLTRVVDHTRISYVKCSIHAGALHLLYDAIQYFMTKYQLPDYKTISVTAYDGNTAVIIRTTDITPWMDFAYGRYHTTGTEGKTAEQTSSPVT